MSKTIAHQDRRESQVRYRPGGFKHISEIMTDLMVVLTQRRERAKRHYPEWFEEQAKNSVRL